MKTPSNTYRTLILIAVTASVGVVQIGYGQTPGFVPYSPAAAPPRVVQQPAIADPFGVQQPAGFITSTSAPAYRQVQATPQYGTPPVPQYGTPPVPQQQFGTPPVPQYGTSPAPQYGTPPVPQQQFGTPPVPQYGTPPIPQAQFGTPPVPQQQFGTPPVPQAYPYPQQIQQVPPNQPGYVPQNYAGQQPIPALVATTKFLNCNPTSVWSTQLNWLYMTRTKPNSFPLLVNAGGATLVDAENLDYGWNSGFDVALSHRRKNGSNFELRYFQIIGWSAEMTPAFQAGDGIATNPPSFLAGAGAVNYLADSKLYSFELNIVNRSVNYERIRYSLGFRWMEVSENLAQTFTPTGPPEVFTIDTNAHLYGLQFGSDGVLYSGNRFNLVGWGKGGLYANVGDQSTTVTDGGALVAANGARDTVASFVSELGVLGEFRLFPRMSLVGGYQFLWISGTALAPDQLPNMSSIATGIVPTGLDQSTAFYQGVFAGVDFHW